MGAFKEVSKNFNFSKEEEKILSYWDKIDAFKRSISQRKDSQGTPYNFYDGPPFATGLPHYGHIVASFIKDTVARYFTMKGHYVERRFGWDTHGLPIEMEAEKKLGLSGPTSIREFGIDKFNEECRSGVLAYTKQWRQTITRAGRWVDFDNDYKTLDVDFMESVWWVFRQLWDKGLVYQGFRVMPYSVRLSTPLSNFEANLNYQKVQDPSITLKVPLLNKPDVSLLVWTTTPWTLPSNLAVAVKKDVTYAQVSLDDGQNYIVAKDLLGQVFKKQKTQIVETFLGQELQGESYEIIYPHEGFKNQLGEDLQYCHKVILSDHVTCEQGTGIVHMAPSFGADDYAACQKNHIPTFDPLDEEGRFTSIIKNLSGKYFKDADKEIVKDLKDKGKIFAHETIDHSYPFCWRSNTPLIYKAMPVWFIDVPKIKDRMSLLNKKIHWVPSAIGEKRFANWLKDAQEWSVSRNRFWGTPIPIWQCSKCQETICLGSKKELEEKTGAKIEDLHSHFIDHLKLSCSKCSGTMSRIPEVFDCWFESGSMPVAQVHYPFENQDEFKKTNPADFIAEGLDQTRGWFYTLLVISAALFDKEPFKNVIVNGLVLASDGSKMSKSKKNYPDPNEVINKYGSDALRTYLLGSSVVRAEPLQFNEEGVKEVVKSVLIPLYNSWLFFNSYANIDKFNPKEDFEKAPSLENRSKIDRWILSKLHSLVDCVNKEMQGYYLYKTINPLLAFIDDLTNWYIRRSRRRFWKNAKNNAEAQDKLAAYATLYEVLVTFSKAIAPLMPFFSEIMYQNLVVEPKLNKPHEDSIHLCDFPVAKKTFIDKSLEKEIAAVRTIVALARAIREKHRIKVRQPLEKITVVVASKNDIDSILSQKHLIESELNVKNVIVTDSDENLCSLVAKPNFKVLGPKFGKFMKPVSAFISALKRADIHRLEKGEKLTFGEGKSVTLEDVVITRISGEGTQVLTDSGITVALDTNITPKLRLEGLMRDVVSNLQKLRKEQDFHVTDRIQLLIFTDDDDISQALENHRDYVAHELLASKCEILPQSKKSDKAIKHDVDEHEFWVEVSKA